VNGPKIQHLIEQNLRRAVARIAEVPRPDPLPGSPLAAMSVLQKAIRRGNKDLALRAAAALLRDAPDRLFRRLGCIAAEEIGLGDLDAVGIATAALAGVRKRADLGGAWPVACAVVAALADAPKCRAADDLSMICELHPVNARQRIEFRHRSSRELAEIVCGATTIDKRAVALWCALGGGPRHVGLRRRRSETQTVFDRLREAGWPTTLVEVARASFSRTGEPLGLLLALLARQLMEPSRGEAEEFPAEVAIDGTPEAHARRLRSRIVDANIPSEGRHLLSIPMDRAKALGWLPTLAPRRDASDVGESLSVLPKDKVGCIALFHRCFPRGKAKHVA
jgi:hypothetical protein